MPVRPQRVCCRMSAGLLVRREMESRGLSVARIPHRDGRTEFMGCKQPKLAQWFALTVVPFRLFLSQSTRG
jgi:hypothetical protein